MPFSVTIGGEVVGAPLDKVLSAWIMYRETKRHFLLTYVALASVLHVLFFFFFAYLDGTADSSRLEEVVFEIDPSLFETSDRELQIVETEKLDNKKIPEKTVFLGKKNQTVEKQTKAFRVGKLRKGQGRDSFNLRQLVPSYPLTRPQEGSGRTRKRFSTQAQPHSSQSAANDDYLKNITKGTNTLLSTKEFIYFGYYHRIREKLRSSWHSELYGALQGYLQRGKRLVPGKDYITRLVVVLDRHGRVQSVRVLENSGAVELDHSAVEAFNRAGPFPNPPKGLMKKGHVEVRWDFVLQS